MTPVEERLTAALEARAGQVHAGQVDAAAPTRTRRSVRAAAPWLAAVAVLVLVAGIALVVRPDGSRAPDPAPTPLPTPTTPALPTLEPVHPALAAGRWYDAGEVYSPNGPDTLPTVDLQEDPDGTVSLFWGLSGVGRSVEIGRDHAITERWRLLGATTSDGGFLVRHEEVPEGVSSLAYVPVGYRWVVNGSRRLVALELPAGGRRGDLWLDASGVVHTWEPVDADADPRRVQQVRVRAWRAEGRRAVPTELGTYCVRPVSDSDPLDTVRVPEPC